MHLVCRADWLAGALKRKGYGASVHGPAVESAAPRSLVDRLLSYHPPRHHRFFSC
jgi:hypothetical protein